MYFGVHYPHDIVSGWICAILLFTVFKYFFLKPPYTAPSPVVDTTTASPTTTTTTKMKLLDAVDFDRVGFLLVLFIGMLSVTYFGGDALRGHIGFYYCPGK